MAGIATVPLHSPHARELLPFTAIGYWLSRERRQPAVGHPSRYEHQVLEGNGLCREQIVRAG